MIDLEAVDKVEVHVLIDNVTDSHSTIHNHAESEFSYLERHGMAELSGDGLCCACHGFSCLITAHRGALRHTVLFDAGPEEYAFERNSKRLGVALGDVETIVLSHMLCASRHVPVARPALAQRPSAGIQRCSRH